MFHDQKFCKSALLKSTSFSPLTSWQKIFDAFEMIDTGRKRLSQKRVLRAELSITPLLAGLLAACGGDTTYIPVGGGSGTFPGGGGPGQFNALDFNLYVADGVVEGARVYVDTNGNGVIDSADVAIGTTNGQGLVLVSGQYAGLPLLVDVSGARDLFTGEILPNGIVYKAISNERGGSDVVASPISTVVDGIRSQDPDLSDEEILEMLFGTGTPITMSDLNNPDNFILPTTSAARPAGSPGDKAEKIATLNIQLQALAEQENGDFDEVVREVLDNGGFDATDDLDSNSQSEANTRLQEARERASGEPIANPATGVNGNEDNDLAIAEEVWGFRDPVGNVNTLSNFASIRITSITNGISAIVRGELVHIAEDGTETVYGAGETIPANHLSGLVFRPNDNYFGDIVIVYTVFDGEQNSDPAELTLTINSVNDNPTDIELSGDRDTGTDKTEELYVLSDGQVILANGDQAGLLTATDPAFNEDDDNSRDFTASSYTLGGAHGALFEVVDATDASGNAVVRLQLREGAEPITPGQTYQVIVTITDSNGGSYSETFEIVQGGLYIDVAGERTYSDGDGLIEENTETAPKPNSEYEVNIHGLVFTFLNNKEINVLVRGVDTSTQMDYDAAANLLTVGISMNVTSSISFSTLADIIAELNTADSYPDFAALGGKVALASGVDNAHKLNFGADDSDATTIEVTPDTTHTATFARGFREINVHGLVFKTISTDVVDVYLDSSNSGTFAYDSANNQLRIFVQALSSVSTQTLAELVAALNADSDLTSRGITVELAADATGTDKLNFAADDSNDATIEVTKGSTYTFSAGPTSEPTQTGTILGTLGVEGLPSGASGVTYTLVAGDGDRDNGQVHIDSASGQITFIGANSGDFDIGTNPDGARDNIQIRVQSSYTETLEHVADFNGQTGIDASGDGTDGDTREFSLTGGGLSHTDPSAEDIGSATAGLVTIDTSEIEFRLGVFGLPDERETVEDAINDGDKDDAGAKDYWIAPINSGGSSMYFTFAVPEGADGFVNGSIKFFVRKSAGFEDENDGGVVEFRLGDTVVWTGTIDSTDSNLYDSSDGTVTLTPPADVVFDNIKFTLRADTGTDAIKPSGSLREVEIFGTPNNEADRVVTVNAGTIYTADGRTITFEETDLQIAEQSYIIVDDADGDGTYEARAVATLPEGDDYYVLGTSEPLKVATSTTTAAAKANTFIGTLYVEADTAGADGNNIQVVVAIDSATAGSGVVSISVSGNVITMTLRADGATNSAMKLALDASAEASALVDVSFSSSVASDVYNTAVTSNLSGGADETTTTGERDGVAPTANAGTQQTSGPLTWTRDITEEHEYVINLQNIDDNAPIFDAYENEVTTLSSVIIQGVEFIYQPDDFPAAGFFIGLDNTSTSHYLQSATRNGVEGFLFLFDGPVTRQQVIDAVNGDITEIGGRPVADSRPTGTSLILARLAEAGTGGQAFIYDTTETLYQLNAGGVQRIVNYAENTATDTVVFSVRATDADNVEGQAPNDVITYALLAGQGDNAFFTIDANTGEVRFINNPNFELKTSYEVHIEATSTSSLGAGSVKKVTTKYTVNLQDVNEAPTDIVLSGDVLQVPTDGTVPAGGIFIGATTISDVDANDTHTLAITGADAALFEIRNGNELWFIGTADDLKGPGELYDVVLTATDAGNNGAPLSYTAPAFSITQSGVYVTPPLPVVTREINVHGLVFKTALEGAVSVELGTAGSGFVAVSYNEGTGVLLVGVNNSPNPQSLADLITRIQAEAPFTSGDWTVELAADATGTNTFNFNADDSDDTTIEVVGGTAHPLPTLPPKVTPDPVYSDGSALIDENADGTTTTSASRYEVNIHGLLFKTESSAITSVTFGGITSGMVAHFDSGTGVLTFGQLSSVYTIDALITLLADASAHAGSPPAFTLEVADGVDGSTQLNFGADDGDASTIEVDTSARTPTTIAGVTGINLGTIGDHSGSARFTTSDTGFSIVNNVLYYTGSDVGDFENGDTQTITITGEIFSTLTGFTGQTGANVNGVDATSGTFHFTGGVTLAGGVATITDGIIYAANAGGAINFVAPTTAIEGVEAGHYFWVAQGDHDGDAATANVWFVQSGAALPTDGVFYVLGTATDADTFAASGTATTATDTEWVERRFDYEYVINLENVDDNAPVFAPLDVAEPIEWAENTDASEVVFQVQASDADNVEGEEPTDTIRYELIAGDGDNAFFTIDALTGEVRFINTPDYETQQTYVVAVKAISTSTLGDGSTREATQSYTINLEDNNDAPTGASISRAALVANSVEVGNLTALDDDILTIFGRTNTDTHTFELVAGEGDTDNALFEIVNGNQLRFIGTDGDASTGGDNPGDDGRKNIGESYSVRILVTDADGETAEQILIIAEGSTYIYTDTDSDGSPDADEPRKYSNFVDTQGDGLLDENADGSTTRILIGNVGDEGGADRYTLATAAADNNNDEFEIDGGKLYYIGSDSGNFETGDEKKIVIEAHDDSRADQTLTGFTGQEDAFANGASGSVFHYTGAITLTGTSWTAAGGTIYDEATGETITYVAGSGAGGITASTTVLYVYEDTTTGSWTTATSPSGASVITASRFFVLATINAAGDGWDLGGTARTTTDITFNGISTTTTEEDYVVKLADVNDAPEIASVSEGGIFKEVTAHGIVFRAKDTAETVTILFSYHTLSGVGNIVDLNSTSTQLVIKTSDADLTLTRQEVIDFVNADTDFNSRFTAFLADGVSASEILNLGASPIELSHFTPVLTNSVTHKSGATEFGATIHGIEFIAKDGVANADTLKIAFDHTTTSDNADFDIGTNTLTISVDDSVSLQTLAGLINWLNTSGDTSDARDKFIIRLADGVDGDTAFDITDATRWDGNSYDVAGLNAPDPIPVTEAGAVTITEAMLGLSDEDANDNDADGNLLGDMLLKVSDLQNGKFQLSGADVTQFTLADVRAGNVQFVHDGGEQFEIVDGFKSTTERPTQFTLIANDGESDSRAVIFELDVTPVNDAPDATETSTAYTIDEGATLAIMETHLKTPDVDDARDGVIYTLQVLPANGELQLSGTALGVGDTFTQDDINANRLTYVHNGSETTTDSFQYVVDDGNEDDSDPVAQTFSIAITPVNDAPTRDPATDTPHDYVGDAAANNPIGDNEVTEEDISEGGIYILTHNDLGVYDPDDEASAITYTVKSLPATAQGKLRKLGVGADGVIGTADDVWADMAIGNTFTLEELRAGRIRFEHSGATPDPISFRYTFKDDEVAESAEQTINITVKELNDVPSDPDLGVNRIDPAALGGDLVATLTTVDEETTDQTAFTYVLINDPESDNHHFIIQGQELRLTTQAGIFPKLDGETYVIRIAVTDVGVGTDVGQTANTKIVEYRLPVRSFDVDWDTTTNGVQAAPLREFDLDGTHTRDSATNLVVDANALTIGTFKIDPGNDPATGQPITTGTYEVIVPDQTANDFGKILVTGSGQTRTVKFATHLDSPVLKALAADEELTVSFFLEIRYTPQGSTDADGFRRSIETFTITFRGTNDAPSAVDPDKVIFEDTAKDGIANGNWDFYDPDTGALIQATGVAISAGTGSTPVAKSLIVDSTHSSYDANAEEQVTGKYGDFYLRADGMWRYVRDDAKVQAVSLEGSTDTFRIRVVDTNGGESAPLDIVITVRGENDAPEMYLSTNSGVVIDKDVDQTDITAAVTETTSSGTSNSALTQSAAQKTDGRWLAGDIDEGAVLRLFVGSFELGEFSVNKQTDAIDIANTNNTLEYVGRYGKITFKEDGTYEYTLTALAEKIAHDETPVDSFAVRVVDQYGASSNIVTLDITVTGTNDAPTALSEGTTTDTGEGGDDVADKGTVIESSFRQDDDADFTVTNGQTTAPALPAASPLVATEERREDRDDNDVDNTAVISGVLDAQDIDRIDSDGRAQAADFHSFELLGGSGASSRHSSVTLTDANGVHDTNPREKLDPANPVAGDVIYSFKGVYGTLELDRFTGEWTYRLDNTDADTYALDGGDSVTDVFTIKITDEEGASVNDIVTITVTGTDDAPILGLGGAQDIEATEKGGTLNAAAGNDASGTFTMLDDDADDTPNAYSVRKISYTDGAGTVHDSAGSWAGSSPNSVAGQYGHFGRHSGSDQKGWKYVIDENNADVQALDPGDTLVDRFEVQIRIGADDDLYSNVITYEITIHGANDAPTLVISPSGHTHDTSVTEGGVVGAGPSFTVHGIVFTLKSGQAAQTAVFDVDSSSGVWQRSGFQEFVIVESRTRQQIIDTINADSDSAYTLSLASGSSGSDTISSSAWDATPNQIASSGGSDLSASGTVTFDDVDGGDNGSNLIVRFGNSSSSVTTTIDHGANNVAVQGLVESSVSSVAGTNLGSFSLSRSTAGQLSWTFTLIDNAANALGAGQTATVSIWIQIGDDGGLNSETRKLTVTVTGSNDAPTLTANTRTGTRNEGQTGTATGSLAFADVDDNDPNNSLTFRAAANSSTSSVANAESGVDSTTDIGSTDLTFTSGSATIAGTYGTFTLTRNDGTGELSWSYAIGTAANVQALGATETVYDSIGVYVNDGDVNSGVQTVTITITGINDAPTLTAATRTGTRTEGATGTVTGSLTFGDVDNDDPNSGLHIRANTGTGTTATIAEGQVNTVGEIGSSNLSFSSNSVTITGTYGVFTLTRTDSTGNLGWSYALSANNAVDSLYEGETVYETLGIYVNDGTANSPIQSVTITITGQNDAPTLSLTTPSDTSVTEDDSSDNSVSFTINLDDADDDDPDRQHDLQITTGTEDPTSSSSSSRQTVQFGDIDTVPASTTTIAGTYGNLVITFTANDKTPTAVYTLATSGAQYNALQALGASESETDKFNFAFGDGRSWHSGSSNPSISITVNGVNDDPVIGATNTAVNYQENQAHGTDVLALSATDVDGDTLRYTFSGADASAFEVDSSGNLQFKSGSLPDYDGTSPKRSYSVTVTVHDRADGVSGGGTDTHTVTVTITNDTSDDNSAPAFGGDTTGSVAENTATKTTVATISITDDGAALSSAERAIVTTNATGIRLTGDSRFGIERAGSSGNNFNIFLKAGQTLNYETVADRSIVLTVRAQDSDDAVSTQTVTISTTNVNEAATGKPTISGTAAVGQTLTANLGSVADPDGIPSTSATHSAYTWEWYHDDTPGTNIGTGRTYTVKTSDAGEEIRVRVKYTSVGSTESRASDATSTVPTPNVAPTLTTSDSAYSVTGTVREDDIPGVITGKIVAADSDGSITGYSVTTDSSFGTLTVATDGTWTYTLNSKHSLVNNLGGTGTRSDSAGRITVTDDDGGTVVATITITIQGRTDRAGTDAADTLTGTSAHETIQGGNLDDTITTGGGNDVVIGGYGDDTITLGAGTDTVVYRMASLTSTVRADDGGDTITGFNRGTDKLVFLDTDSTALSGIDALIALAKASTPLMNVKLLGTAASYTGIAFEFTETSKDDGPSGVGATSGLELSITFSSAIGNAAAVINILGTGSYSVSSGVLTSAGLDNLGTLFGTDNLQLYDDADYQVDIL